MSMTSLFVFMCMKQTTKAPPASAKQLHNSATMGEKLHRIQFHQLNSTRHYINIVK